MRARVFSICLCIPFLAPFVFSAPPRGGAEKTNVVIVLADDLGYGDLGCYGHPSIRTPSLDRMAREGLRFTDFYSPSEVCTPSRAGVLTGRHAIRSGMSVGSRRVLFPDSAGGLPPGEITIAQALKGRGYATAHVGKWHLGVRDGARPLERGFDHSFGLPYSNDMDARPGLVKGAAMSPEPPADGWDVPLLRDGEIVERPAVQATLTRRYTEEAVAFIRRNRATPFFLYLAHTMPHVPLFASGEFRGRSARGLYGDVVEELDAGVGRILDALCEEGIAGRTLVFFTSDNGPWLTQGAQGGSAGLLREGKGSTWEGGMRVPGIAWWPGRVRPGVTGDPAGGVDLFPTALSVVGVPLPGDRAYDGIDLTPLLCEGRALPRRPYFYHRGAEIFACRLGAWKAHWRTQAGYGQRVPETHEPPLLYHLGNDPSERFDVAAAHPDVVAEIRAAVEAHRAGLIAGAPQVD